jgi:preprotein translocase subunit SecY
MSSAAEQLAANLDLRLFAKATELKKRIWFTLAALIVYRLGTYIPLPGIDPSAMADITRHNSGGVLGMVNMFSGGALGRMTIFALNVIPYISASIIVQLLATVYAPLEALRKEGDSGRRKLNQYTRYGTVVLAAFQAYAMSASLLSSGAVLIAPFFFKMSSVIIIVGGTMFLMWLGEQITSRGIGNGVSLIIFSGIVANLPQAALNTLELGQEGKFPFMFIFLIMILIAAVIAFIVFMERAQRKVLVQYPKRQMGNRMTGGETNHLPLKLNNAGVIPPIFASSLLLLPLTIGSFTSGTGPAWLQSILYYLNHGRPLYMVLYSALIVFFAFFYTALVFNPEDTSENLKKSGGFVPGIRPGKNTADYFDYLLTRLTVIGSAYLVFVCLLPEFLMTKYSLPFYFGGTSLLIVVSVTMDTVAQVHSHLLAHQYEGLLKKANLKGRRR